MFQGDLAGALQPSLIGSGSDAHLEKSAADPGASPDCTRRLHGLLPHLRLHAGPRLHLLPRTQVSYEEVGLVTAC